MRSLLLLVIMATSIFGFIFPGGLPTKAFVGRVISMEKVTDVGVIKDAKGRMVVSETNIKDADKDKILHWESWKAEVQVESARPGAARTFKDDVSGVPDWKIPLDTNIMGKVIVYYEVDWSTNFVCRSWNTGRKIPATTAQHQSAISFLLQSLSRR